MFRAWRSRGGGTLRLAEPTTAISHFVVLEQTFSHSPIPVIPPSARITPACPRAPSGGPRRCRKPVPSGLATQTAAAATASVSANAYCRTPLQMSTRPRGDLRIFDFVEGEGGRPAALGAGAGEICRTISRSRPMTGKPSGAASVARLKSDRPSRSNLQRSGGAIPHTKRVTSAPSAILRTNSFTSQAKGASARARSTFGGRSGPPTRHQGRWRGTHLCRLARIRTSRGSRNRVPPGRRPAGPAPRTSSVAPRSMESFMSSPLVLRGLRAGASR